ANLLFGRNDLIDDHNALKWHGPRFSNTDSVFSWFHERSAKRGAKNVRAVTERFRTSWCGRQPRFCRSRKQDFVRLRHESNGTIAPSKRKIAAVGRRRLQVKTARMRVGYSWSRRLRLSRPTYSPITVTKSFRRWGARRCSKRKMPCQVPSCI